MKRWMLACGAVLLAAAVLAPISTASAASAPGTPAGITVTRSTSGSPATDTLAVTWTSPGGSYLEYEVAYMEDTDEVFDPSPSYDWTGWTKLSGTMRTTSASITDLDTGKSWVVAVRARDRATGAWGAWGSSGLLEPAGLPGRTSGIAITARRSGTPGSLDITWSAATGAAAYGVRVKQPNDAQWGASHESASAVLANVSAPGGDETKTFVIQVRSKTASGTCGSGGVKCSRWVDSGPLYRLDVENLSAAVSPTDMSAPFDVKATWDRLSVTGVSYEIRFYYRTGEPPSAAQCTTGNIVVPSLDHDLNDTDPCLWWERTGRWGDWAEVSQPSPGTTVSHTFTGARRTAGLTMRLQVRPKLAGVYGVTEHWTSRPPTAPNEPLDVSLSSPSGASVKLQWAIPFDHGSPIAGFGITLVPEDVSKSLVTVSPTTGTPFTGPGDPRRRWRSYTFHDLETDETYWARVWSINGEGVSDPVRSNSVNLTPTAPPAPAPPTVSVSGTTATLTWEAPVDDGGATVSGYGVQYRKQNADDTWPTTWTSHANTGTGLTTTVNGLTSGSAYQFQVRAVNSVGDGAWSASTVGDVP